MKRDGKNIFELQAEVCRAIANPKRLEIISALKEAQELNVGQIVEILQIPKANVSQHLTVMRGSGILLARKDGSHTYYRIAHKNVIKACALMRQVLIEKLRNNEKLIGEMEGAAAHG